MMTEKITSGQENRIGDLTRDALRGMGFSKEDAQEVIENGDTLQAEFKKILKKLAEANRKFGAPISEFELTVPADYNHDTQIDTSGKKARKEKTTYHYNDDLNSKNFANATNKLVPGKTYKVKVFPILKTVTSEDCMALLRKHKAILVGGQGVTLVYDLAKDKLPKGKWTVSFDEETALWKDADGDRRVPSVNAYTDGDFKFSLGRFGPVWYSGRCVLCFCDLSA